MPSTNYCTIEDVLVWLAGVDTTPLTNKGVNLNGLITRMLPTAKAEMVKNMGQDLVQQERLIRMDGSGLTYITLPFWPVLRVLEAKIFWGYNQLFYSFVNIRHEASQPEFYGIPSEDQGDADLIVNRDTGRLTINPFSISLQSSSVTPLWNLTWSVQKENVLIKAITGFDGVQYPFPQDVVDAQAKRVAKEIGAMAAQARSGGASSVKIMDEAISWGEGGPYAAMFKEWAGDIARAEQRFNCMPYNI